MLAISKVLVSTFESTKLLTGYEKRINRLILAANRQKMHFVRSK